MNGLELTERFAEYQMDPNMGPVEVTLRIFRDMFFPPNAQQIQQQDQQQPRRQLRVFGAGLPRSGTGSLAVALSKLGYRPIHGAGTIELAPILDRHYKYDKYEEHYASNLDIIDWQEDHGYDAQGLDQLGWKLYKEVADHYPDVKIILTVHPRGAQAWSESFTSCIPRATYWFQKYPFKFSASWQTLMILWEEIHGYISGGKTSEDSIFEYPGHGLANYYEQHNQRVIEYVPSERLLVFDPSDGWEPLCEFLEISEESCPKTPYPNMTLRNTIIVLSKVTQAIVLIWCPGIPMLIVLILLVVYKKRRRRKQKQQ